MLISAILAPLTGSLLSNSTLTSKGRKIPQNFDECSKREWAPYTCIHNPSHDAHDLLQSLYPTLTLHAKRTPPSGMPSSQTLPCVGTTTTSSAIASLWSSASQQKHTVMTTSLQPSVPKRYNRVARTYITTTASRCAWITLARPVPHRLLYQSRQTTQQPQETLPWFSN